MLLKSFIQYVLLAFVVLCLLIGVPWCCLDGFMEWQKIRHDKKSPLVKGFVVKREPIIYKGIIPGAKFLIKVENSDETVHAKTQRYLLNKIPDRVNFHYTGNPTREVYLMDFEENPFWMFVICLFGTIFITTPLMVFLFRWLCVYVFGQNKTKLPLI